MDSRDIRNSKGQLVGRITQEGRLLTLRDARGIRLGYVLEGRCYDDRGLPVGSAEMLSTLLPPG